MARSLLVVVAVLALAVRARAMYCFNCPFKFCYGEQKVILGKPDTPLRGPICRKDGVKIGIFNTGEPYVYTQGRFGYERISVSRPPGLQKNFSDSLFKGYPIEHYFPKLGKSAWVSGVGHEHFQYNQKDLIKNQCIILPVTNYQILDHDYNIRINVNGAGPWHDSCIAFRVA